MKKRSIQFLTLAILLGLSTEFVQAIAEVTKPIETNNNKINSAPPTFKPAPPKTPYEESSAGRAEAAKKLAESQSQTPPPLPSTPAPSTRPGETLATSQPKTIQNRDTFVPGLYLDSNNKPTTEAQSSITIPDVNTQNIKPAPPTEPHAQYLARKAAQRKQKELNSSTGTSETVKKSTNPFDEPSIPPLPSTPAPSTRPGQAPAKPDQSLKPNSSSTKPLTVESSSLAARLAGKIPDPTLAKNSIFNESYKKPADNLNLSAQTKPQDQSTTSAPAQPIAQPKAATSASTTNSILTWFKNLFSSSTRITTPKETTASSTQATSTTQKSSSSWLQSFMNRSQQTSSSTAYTQAVKNPTPSAKPAKPSAQKSTAQNVTNNQDSPQMIDDSKNLL
jgi:hypothetical protein